MLEPSSLFVTPLSVGAKASLLEAIMPLYLPPTLEPERTMPPGNGVMTPGTLSIAATAASAARKRLGIAFGQQQQIAAADRFLGHTGRRLDEKFAVHDRHAPEMAVAELLGDLPAITEIAQRGSELKFVAARSARQNRRCPGR